MKACRLFLLTAAFLIFLCAAPSIQASLWLTNNPMIIGRTLFSATFLPNGQVLLAGGSLAGVPSGAAELYDPKTGVWTQTGSLNTPRYGHKAVLLPNGKVLALGGYDGSDYVTSAELYDPQTGSWAPTAAMGTSRYICTATLLLNGTVLVAGGSSDGTNTPTAELYDPVAGSWSPTGNMQDGRVEHTATLLRDGRVLVAGGIGSVAPPGSLSGLYETLSSMELYDPASGTWTSTGPLNQARLGHTATLLPNGQVLFTGGTTNGLATYPFSSAEIYDPVAGTSTTIQGMNSARFLHTADLLPNGTAIVIGGMTDSAGDAVNTAEIYDPSSGAWTLTNSLNTARFLHSTTLLPGGDILIAGGTINNLNVPLASTELYDPIIAPSTGTWTNTGSMQTARMSFTLTLLPNGQVLAAGGLNSSEIAACELYNPVTGVWTSTGSLNFGRHAHTATLLPNGKVLVVGVAGVMMAPPEIFDPNTGVWTTNNWIDPHDWHTATLLSNGKVLVAGESSWGTNSAELYDPVANTWTSTGEMITPRELHKAVQLTNGTVLVVGGDSNFVNLASAELYNPISGTWSSAGTNRAASEYFTAAALLPNGQVLVAGEDTNALPVADLYNSTNGTWTATGTPYTNHFSPKLTVLPNGKALLAGDDPTPEIYDPATGQWTVTASMNVQRQNFASILLPDGHVLAAGDLNFGNTAELYDVGLGFSNSWRPQITSAPSTVYLSNCPVLAGSGFRGMSGVSSGNLQSSPTDFPAVQLRAIEGGQTTFLYTTNWSTNSFASLSITNFPMGYALATVFVGGIQSTSAIVDITISNSISLPVPVMTALSNPKITANGFQFTFTNTPGVAFDVLASTNLNMPFSNWTDLGTATETSSGQFQFVDPQAGANRRRFYIILSP